MATDDPPRSFLTTDGRVWPVALTYAAAKRIKAACGVKVGELMRDGWGPLGELFDDLERFVDVLFETVRPQAERDGVTPEAFAAVLGGDAIEQAQAAWLRAYADFCPSRSRPLLLAMAAKGAEVARLATERATKEVTGIDPETVISTASSGTSPGSAASTPTP